MFFPKSSYLSTYETSKLTSCQFKKNRETLEPDAYVTVKVTIQHQHQSYQAQIHREKETLLKFLDWTAPTISPPLEPCLWWSIRELSKAMPVPLLPEDHTVHFSSDSAVTQPRIMEFWKIINSIKKILDTFQNPIHYCWPTSGPLSGSPFTSACLKIRRFWFDATEPKGEMKEGFYSRQHRVAQKSKMKNQSGS